MCCKDISLHANKVDEFLYTRIGHVRLSDRQRIGPNTNPSFEVTAVTTLPLACGRRPTDAHISFRAIYGVPFFNKTVNVILIIFLCGKYGHVKNMTK
jgi:hypothetical protein